MSILPEGLEGGKEPGGAGGRGGEERGGFRAFLAHLNTVKFMTRVVRNFIVSRVDAKKQHNSSALPCYLCRGNMSVLSGFDMPSGESSLELVA